jgi:hypothetical protein
VASLSLGNRVVAFCRAHLGQKVGNGECAGLAYQALKSAGAAPRGGPDYPGKGDYVWGRQVVLVESSPSGPKLTGAFSQIQPGDIMQYRDVRFDGSMPSSHGVVNSSRQRPRQGIRRERGGRRSSSRSRFLWPRSRTDGYPFTGPSPRSDRSSPRRCQVRTLSSPANRALGMTSHEPHVPRVITFRYDGHHLVPTVWHEPEGEDWMIN